METFGEMHRLLSTTVFFFEFSSLASALFLR